LADRRPGECYGHPEKTSKIEKAAQFVLGGFFYIHDPGNPDHDFIAESGLGSATTHCTQTDQTETHQGQGGGFRDLLNQVGVAGGGNKQGSAGCSTVE
jgi:hypothetical protein